MGAAVIADTHEFFQAIKPFVLAGRQVEPGQVIDLVEFGLPPGRSRAMERVRRGKVIQVTDMTGVIRRDELPLANQPAEVPPAEPARPARVDVEGLPPIEDWTDAVCRALTIKQRRELLAAHGLVVRGNKDETVERLLSHKERMLSDGV